MDAPEKCVFPLPEHKIFHSMKTKAFYDLCVVEREGLLQRIRSIPECKSRRTRIGSDLEPFGSDPKLRDETIPGCRSLRLCDAPFCGADHSP